MPRTTCIELETVIAAPPQVCFDLARDVELHPRSLAHTGERAVAGRTTGCIGLDEEVTWRARHFGLMHEHTARITAFEPPRHFRDTMVRGRFAPFVHDHFFEPASGGGTRMRDVVEFRSPGGWLGRAVDRLLLRGYLTRLLARRNDAIRAAAEAAVAAARTAVRTDHAPGGAAPR
jgi:ligand-binding SRPBCC domain-containing protein